jgi:hypothetical protein
VAVVRVGGEALGGGPQRGRGVVSERVAVAEAGDGDVEARQPPERGGGLSAVDVEHAADHGSVRGPRGCVAGEQHLVPGKVDRDAAGRVAGDGDRRGAVAEAEFVAVAELAVNARRCRRFGRDRVRHVAGDLAHYPLEEGSFPVGQVGWRAGRLGADERRVGVVSQHLDVAPACDVGGGADVIGVEVRQH